MCWLHSPQTWVPFQGWHDRGVGGERNEERRKLVIQEPPGKESKYKSLETSPEMDLLFSANSNWNYSVLRRNMINIPESSFSTCTWKLKVTMWMLKKQKNQTNKMPPLPCATKCQIWFILMGSLSDIFTLLLSSRLLFLEHPMNQDFFCFLASGKGIS